MLLGFFMHSLIDLLIWNSFILIFQGISSIESWDSAKKLKVCGKHCKHESKCKLFQGLGHICLENDNITKANEGGHLWQ